MAASSSIPTSSSLATSTKEAASFARDSTAPSILGSVNSRALSKFCADSGPQALISLFRSRAGVDSQRDVEKQTIIDRCDVAIEDGEGVSSRFIARIVFRNGLTSTHRLPFEVAVPVHAKFNKQDSPHHWKIASRTLRQLMDHFGPGIELLDINTDGDHVNFTCFSEKAVTEDGTT